MQNEGGSNTGAVLVAFMLGAVIGAGAALLLAPQSGEDTRKKIRDLAGSIKDKTSDALATGKEYVTERKSAISAAIDAGKEAYKRETGKSEA